MKNKKEKNYARKYAKDFNILTDKLPPNILPYKMNQDTFRIEENKEFRNA